MADNEANQLSELYKVVVNDKGQYFIWPEWKKIPNGWQYGGKAGIKEDCLEFIRNSWLDMRPSSSRTADSKRKRKVSLVLMGDTSVFYRFDRKPDGIFYHAYSSRVFHTL